MSERRATKNHFERENEEADRLVRPAPKVKPPRHDRRREMVQPDKDPDLDKSDKDLSKNYKDIGGSLGARVLTRWRVRERVADAGPDKVKVKHKETGWTGWVNKETLKDKTNEYEVVQSEGDEGPSGAPPEEPKVEAPSAPAEPKVEKPAAPSKDERQLAVDLRDEMKDDPAFASFIKGLSDPNSMGGWPDETQLSRMPPQLLKRYPALEKFNFGTLGDVRKTYERAKQAPKTKGKKPQPASPAPTQEAPPKPEGEEPQGEAPQVDPEKAQAIADAGKQIREKAKEDPALQTVVQQLDGQDSGALYQLQHKLDPAADISKTVPGLPENIKSVGDLVDAVKATKPAEAKPEGKKEKAEKPESNAAVDKLVKTIQNALHVEPREEMHEDDKAETSDFVKAKGHESKEFVDWANAENSTLTGEDGKPLFYDEKREKHVPFDKLPVSEQYDWKRKFDRGEKLRKNLADVKEFAAKNPEFDQLLKDLTNRKSEISGQIEELGEGGHLMDVRKAIPDLRDAELPKGIRTVGDLMEMAGTVHKPIPQPARRKFTEQERQRAHSAVIDTFPTEVAAKLLASQPPLHPDDIHELVSNYNTAKVHTKDGELTKLVQESGYQTDPDQVQPPSMGVNANGEEVQFDQLKPKEQAAAMAKHRMFVVAMSLAAREKEVESLEKKTGAPKELLGAIADMTLSHRPGESPEERSARGKDAAKKLFVDAVKRGFMHSDTDEYARWKQKREKQIGWNKFNHGALEQEGEYDPENDPTLPPPPPPKEISGRQVEKLLKHFGNDPAAQQLVAGYGQATDYLQARHKFLDPDSEDSFSEQDSPNAIVKGIRRMGEFFDRESTKYPEDMRDLVSGKEQLRNQVVDRIRDLSPEKYPIVKKLVQEQEFDEYEDKLKAWQKAYDKYSKKWGEKPKDPYRDQAQPAFPDPPRRPGGYTEARGDKSDQNSEKDELLNRYRRHMGVPQGTEKTAHRLWTVVDRYLNDSSCRADQAMGDRLSIRVAEKAKLAVYWGVEPYPKGHDGVAPYTKWEQVHQRDLGDNDFDVILKSAREWLRAPVLSSAVEGIYRDTQLRAALDLALRSCENGKYSVGLQPPLYNMLLARLGGASPNETLLTDRSNITGPVSVYASTGVKTPMKASAKIRQAAAKYASTHPVVAYDLIDLADKVAQDEQGQQEPAQDQKQGGQVPPQFLEHMKGKKDEGEKKDEQGQGQQKEASYSALRSVVIRTAAANPKLAAAFRPLLETIKKIG